MNARHLARADELRRERDTMIARAVKSLEQHFTARINAELAKATECRA